MGFKIEPGEVRTIVGERDSHARRRCESRGSPERELTSSSVRRANRGVRQFVRGRRWFPRRRACATGTSVAERVSPRRLARRRGTRATCVVFNENAVSRRLVWLEKLCVRGIAMPSSVEEVFLKSQRDAMARLRATPSVGCEFLCVLALTSFSHRVYKKCRTLMRYETHLLPVGAMNSRFRRSRLFRDFGATKATSPDSGSRVVDIEQDFAPHPVEQGGQTSSERKTHRSDGRHATLHPASRIRPPPS